MNLMKEHRKMATRITKRNNAVKPASGNYIDQSRFTYGEQGELKQLNKDVQNLELSEDAATTSQQQAAPQPMANVFEPTNQPTRPVEDGLPFGPGVGPAAEMASTEELIRQFYELTGDPLLARILKR